MRALNFILNFICLFAMALSGLTLSNIASADLLEADPSQIVYNSALESETQRSTKLEQARTEYEAWKHNAEQVLKDKKKPALPAPPSISFKCEENKSKASSKAVDQFIKEMNDPEALIIKNLISTQKTLISLGDPDDGEALDLAGRLQGRVVWKAELLIRKYQKAKDQDKLHAVAVAALKADKEANLLGVQGSSIMSDLASWFGDVEDQYIEDLRARHDYRVVGALLELDKSASLLGAANDISSLEDKLSKALTFQAGFDNKTGAVGSNGQLAYILSGEVKNISPANYFSNNKWEGTGRKAGSYTSCKISQPGSWLVLPNYFPVTVRIEKFDACKSKSVDVYIDRLGAKTETFATSKGSAPVSGVVQATDMALLSDHITSTAGGGEFKFTLPLKNLQKEAANETFDKSLGPLSVSYQLRLEHTPPDHKIRLQRDCRCSNVRLSKSRKQSCRQACARAGSREK
ncbi:MAG: hypothetical protein HZA01_14845 [Nitrospinae bacterium]|nr:hypothetical protein [Nitrospinota bacterium]